MAIARTAMIDDDGSGTTGTIINNAWKQEFYNQIDFYVQGNWTDIPYNAANFYASGGAGGIWTVPSAAQVTMRRCVLGKDTGLIQWNLSGAMTLSASAQFLYLRVLLDPSVRNVSVPLIYYTAAAGTGIAEIAANSEIRLYTGVAGAPWAPFSAGYFLGEIFYSIL